MPAITCCTVPSTKLRRLDLAAQMLGGEIGARRGDAGIEGHADQPFASGTIDNLASAPGM